MKNKKTRDILSSSSSASSSTSSSALFTSSSSSIQKQDYFGDMVFAGNDGIVFSDISDETWKRVCDYENNHSEISFDYKKPFVWAYKDNTSNATQVLLDGTYTANSIENIPNCKNMSFSNSNGNVFVLLDKNNLASESIFGGDLVKYSYFNKVSAIVDIKRNGVIYDLFGSMDSVFDYARNLFWIADTLNHKIISIDKNNNTSYVLESNDYVFPCSLALDVSTGTVFARAYLSATLEEVIIAIRNNSVFSIFRSPGTLGFKTIFPLNSSIFVSGKTTSDSCVYKINSFDGNIENTFSCQSTTIDSVTTECLNGTVFSYGSSKIANFATRNGEMISETNIDIDSRIKTIPSILNSSYWAFILRSDGKYNLAKMRPIELNKTYINNGEASFSAPTAGSVLFKKRTPIILTDLGKYIIRISEDGKTIQSTKNLSLNHDIIDTKMIDETIVISKKNEKRIKTMDWDFSNSYDYAFTNNILDIAVNQNETNCFWILDDSNQLFKTTLSGGTITIVNSIVVSSSEPISGVRHSCDNGGAIVFSEKNIYKISQDGTIILWQSQTFGQIDDVSVMQNMSTVYENNFEYEMLSSKSMAFDTLRNKLWWISLKETPQLCSLDNSDYSASAFALPLEDIEHTYEEDSSETLDKLKSPISMSINHKNGNPWVVFVTEKQHIVLVEFDREKRGVSRKKFLPKNFNAGFLFMKLDVDAIPFSFESTQSRSNSTDLKFEYNVTMNEASFLSPKNKIDKIFSVPQQTSVILPTEKTSVPEERVAVEVWSNDFSSIKNTRISNLFNMSFSSEVKVNGAYSLPSFSWSHKTTMVSPCFAVLEKSGYLNLMKYELDKKEMVVVKSTYVFVNPETLSSGIQNMFFCSKSGEIAISSKNTLIFVNGSSFKISRIYNNQSVVAYCCDEDANIWGTKNEQNIMKLSGETETTYGVVSFPVKMAFSSFHQKLFIISEKELYYFDPSTNEIKIIDQTESYFFNNLGVLIDGSVVLTMKNNVDNSSIIKVFNPKLVVSKIINLQESLINNASIDLINSVFYISQSNTVSGTNLNVLDLKNNTTIKNQISNKNETFFIYNVAPNYVFPRLPPPQFPLPSNNSGETLLFSSVGNIFALSIEKDKIKNNNAYNGTKEITMVCQAPDHVYDKKLKQIAVRVFVGSNVGNSDRWDSGEIPSDKTEILYGGGNNLEAGQKYYANILVCYDGYGWSSPQIIEFVIPK